jgi:hypothetical protein
MFHVEQTEKLCRQILSGARIRSRLANALGTMFDAVTDDDTCLQAAEIQGDM